MILLDMSSEYNTVNFDLTVVMESRSRSSSCDCLKLYSLDFPSGNNPNISKYINRKIKCCF